MKLKPKGVLPGLAMIVAMVGCQSNQPAQHADGTPAPVVYVTDFTLPPDIIQHDPTPLSDRPGPLGRVGNRLSGASTDPVARAHELVELMANSLVKDLTKAGCNTSRISSAPPFPNQGYLVRGAFTRVDEGNRLRRSMIGMGQGQTDIQVLTCLDDLASGTPRSLQEAAAEASSGNRIGAAPTLALGPYGAAVHFIRSGQDVEKNVVETASTIAGQVVQQVMPTKVAK